jgi:hypothetical protein
MNCKEGDLVIVVGCKTTPTLVGLIFRCVRLRDDWTKTPAWVVDPDPAIPGRYGIEDSCLLPIRDNSEDDETLAWAGKPREIMESIYYSKDPEEFKRFKDAFQNQFG